MAIYAVSDLHGQYDTFIKGLEEIGFGDDDKLYLIGDAIDRGPDGIKILKYIMEHDNMDLIIGNHEFMMLNAVDTDGGDFCNGMDQDLWLYYNGGSKTFPGYAALPEEERKALLSWLRSRYVIETIEVGGKKFCLTHSYYRPEFENKKYNEMEYWDVWKIVWTSVYREGDTFGIFIYGAFDYTFITGHVPVQRVRYERRMDDYDRLMIHSDANLVDIDGGCAIGVTDELENGALFLRLDDMKVYPVPIR